MQIGATVRIPYDHPLLDPSAYRLSIEPNTAFTAAELRPVVEEVSRRYGVPAPLLFGIMAQESRLQNLATHRDRHGTGLIGLDPRGELTSFIRWAGHEVAQLRPPPPELQVEYLAMRLAEMRDAYGPAQGTFATPFDDPSWMAAACMWHCNEPTHPEYPGLIRSKYETFTRPQAPASVERAPAQRPGPAPATSPLLRGLQPPG